MRMEGGFKAIRVLVEKGIGKELNIGFYIIFEKHEDLEIFKKLLNKIKDWGAVRIDTGYLIEYSVSQRIPDALWVRKVNRAGRVEDMDWSDIDRLMEIVEEEYKKVSKPGRKWYHITPYSDEETQEDDISWEEVA